MSTAIFHLGTRHYYVVFSYSISEARGNTNCLCCFHENACEISVKVQGVKNHSTSLHKDDPLYQTAARILKGRLQPGSFVHEKCMAEWKQDVVRGRNFRIIW